MNITQPKVNLMQERFSEFLEEIMESNAQFGYLKLTAEDLAKAFKWGVEATIDSMHASTNLVFNDVDTLIEEMEANLQQFAGA